MKKLIFLLTLIIGMTASAQLRIPFIRVPDKQKQMELQDLAINVQIMGNLATTTYDMTFFNPNDRVLEGEMIFPMSDRQAVVAMALDINGKMRAASAVDKDEARRIFEEQVYRSVDPALIEKVSGNQYKMRIYPFNPKGTRHIQITTEESLPITNNGMKLNIPLTYNKQLKSFALQINIAQEVKGLPTVETDLDTFHFITHDQRLMASFQKNDFMLKNSLSIVIPPSSQDIVYTGHDDKNTYFYSSIQVKPAEQEKVLPKQAAVVWDISGSGNKRDIAKEQKLLLSYLQKIKNVDVEFIPFNINQQKSKSFQIKNGNTTALETYLKGLSYDGATRLEKIDFSKIKVDEILLFTDGIATIGPNLIKSTKTPIYAITSSNSAEYSMLSNLANKTLARHINLAVLDNQQALSQLTHKSLRLISYQVPQSVHDIYPLSSAVVGKDFTFTGIYNGTPATITLKFGFDEQNITETKTIQIGKDQNNQLIPRQWATHKACELELDAINNREQIIQLGKDFSILTEYTSLLVLDSLDDYLKFKVPPKDQDLLDKYNYWVDFNQKKDKYAAEKAKRRAIVKTLRMVNQVKKWWEKDFKQVPPEAPNEPWGFEKDPADIDKQYVTVANGLMVDAKGEMIGRLSKNGRVMAQDDIISAKRAAMSDSVMLDAEEQQETKESKIKLKEWSPNTPYIKELRKESDSNLYAVYLKQKSKYQDMPAFYFDVADEFAKRGMLEQAVLILTNLLEIKTDEVELIRSTAHKLMAYQQYDIAEELFKKVIEMRPEEPQGYRDLAVLYEFSNQQQKALDEEISILNKDWEEFNDDEIKREVFIEMNSLIARHKGLDLTNVDPNLIFNMPVDLRITLGWSSDKQEVGLTVVDPYREGSYNDVTNNGGYHMQSGGWHSIGPESYMIKKAVEGKYEIKANHYYWNRNQSVVLPIFAWVDVYTNFGRENQKHERSLIRMDEVKNNQLGSATFIRGGCAADNPLKYRDECTSCMDTRKLFLSSEKCDLCPNRKMFADFCIQTCAADKPMQSSVGNCYECNNEKALKLSEEECKKCPNREMKFDYCVLNGYNCPAEKPLREGIITCQSCDYAKSMIVSAEDCAKCPNREMLGKYCALKQCPEDKPLQLSNGVCSNCDIPSAEITSAEDCAKCPNREMKGKYCVRKECSSENPVQDKNGECHACNQDITIITDKVECAKCSNRSQFDTRCLLQCSEDKPLQNNKGICYSCDENWEIETSAEQCAKCSNREFDDGKCIKKTCSSDKDIESEDGRCFKCDAKESIHTYKEECDKCSNRYMMKENCVLPCEKEDEVQDIYGNCHKCDINYDFESDEATCNRCPNRTYMNNRCLPPCPEDRPIKDKWGRCHDCDEDYDFETDELECQKCSNRKLFSGFCKIACGRYEPMQDEENNGQCYDCDYEEGLNISETECNKCPNREMVNGACFEKCPDYAPLVDEDGSCYTCDLERIVNRKYARDGYIIDIDSSSNDNIYEITKMKTSAENCAQCSNRIYKEGYCVNKAPAGIFMMDLKNNEWVDCSTDSPLSISKSECDKCINREMIGNVCVLKECPDEEPLQSRNGQCANCYVDELLSISKEQCDKCPNRTMHGPFCTLKECPEEIPMIGNNGRCIGCETDTLFSISPQECAKCPNREMKGNYCVKK